MRTIALSLGALVIGGLFGGPAARAQIQQETTIPSESARLEQMVAPIALYPDTLLMQVLMAATYPLEVVEADRLARQNAGTSADAVEASLADLDWDPSVKALVGYPEVLKMMSENLDWTRDLGEAFLRDQAGLLDTVQRMRQRARDAGTLATTPEQVVTTRSDQIIVVEPVQPSVVYVPSYSPLYVYGGWSYPQWCYPRLYRWWPRSGFSFSLGFGNWGGWGSWFWGRPDWRWGGSSICVDVDLYNRFNRRHGFHWSEHDLAVRDRGNYGSWTHHPEHRRGVAYRDPQVAKGFGQSPRVHRDEARGFARPEIDRRHDAAVGKSFERSSRERFEPQRRFETPRVEPRVDKLERHGKSEPRGDFEQRARVEHRPKVEPSVVPPSVERHAPQVRSFAAPKHEAPRVERRAPEARRAPEPKAAPAPRLQQQSEAFRARPSERAAAPGRGRERVPSSGDDGRENGNSRRGK
jgi:hypothetical protein